MNALATAGTTHTPSGTRHAGTDRPAGAAATPTSLLRTLPEGTQP